MDRVGTSLGQPDERGGGWGTGMALAVFSVFFLGAAVEIFAAAPRALPGNDAARQPSRRGALGPEDAGAAGARTDAR